MRSTVQPNVDYSEEVPMSSPDPAGVGLDEARKLLSSGSAILVDVREQHEWDAGHAV